MINIYHDNQDRFQHLNNYVFKSKHMQLMTSLWILKFPLNCSWSVNLLWIWR